MQEIKRMRGEQGKKCPLVMSSKQCAASDAGQDSLLRSVCPNTFGQNDRPEKILFLVDLIDVLTPANHSLTE